MNQAKSIFASKTFWFNVASVALLALQKAVPDLQFLDPQTQLVVTAIINLGLRYVTTQPVTIGAK